jgi:hypothetical protein
MHTVEMNDKPNKIATKSQSRLAALDDKGKDVRSGEIRSYSLNYKP